MALMCLPIPVICAVRNGTQCMGTYSANAVHVHVALYERTIWMTLTAALSSNRSRTVTCGAGSGPLDGAFRYARMSHSVPGRNRRSESEGG